MKNANFIVVGDIFTNAQYAVTGVLSESDAIEMILHAEPLAQDVVFKIEQGVNVAMLEHAIAHREVRLGQGQGAGHFVLQYGDEMPRAVRRLAHKARAENICVSFPRRLGQHEFVLDLHFSAQNELFLDHMTGVHIQGMALTEAARQAFLTVTEEYFLNESKEKWYFVTNYHNAQFKQFVFPLAARLNYHVKNHTTKNGRHTFEVTMDVFQGEICCCSFDVSFTTFEATRLAQRETELMSERVFDILNTPKNEREFNRSVHALAAVAAQEEPEAAKLLP